MFFCAPNTPLEHRLRRALPTNRLQMRIILITIQTMNTALSTKPAAKPRLLAPNGVARSQDLLGAGSVLMIDHAGERYVLRLTKNGKLILTK